MHVFGLYFGWPAGAVWSNLLASGICSLAVYLRMHAKLKASHKALASQSERQHAELQAQAQAHHNELLHQAEKHHRQASALAESHLVELKAHVSASPPVASRTRRGPL